MLSRNELKFIRSLHRRKERDNSRLFLAEGTKLISDLLASGASAHFLFSTEEAPGFRTIAQDEMRAISLLETPSSAFGVFHQTDLHVADPSFILALDRIRDPGNLGTILRTADWFGLPKVYLSEDSVEPYNPKVVQASMGAIARVDVVRGKLPLAEWSNGGYKLMGTAMDGHSVMDSSFVWPEKTVLLMGTEGAGLDASYAPALDQLISIPKAVGSKGESLNLSLATGIFVANYFQSKTSGGSLG